MGLRTRLAMVPGKVRELRLSKPLTCEELAVAAGVSRSTIHRMETDPDAVVAVRSVRRVADALGVDTQLIARLVD